MMEFSFDLSSNGCCVKTSKSQSKQRQSGASLKIIASDLTHVSASIVFVMNFLVQGTSGINDLSCILQHYSLSNQRETNVNTVELNIPVASSQWQVTSGSIIIVCLTKVHKNIR